MYNIIIILAVPYINSISYFSHCTFTSAQDLIKLIHCAVFTLDGQNVYFLSSVNHCFGTVTKPSFNKIM